MDLMNILPRIRPDKTMPSVPKEWQSWEAMKGELEKAGFKDVEALQVETTMSFEKYDPYIDFMVDKMPHMVHLIADFSAEEKAKLKQEMKEEMKKMSPQEPGTLKGVALVAVGRK